MAELHQKALDARKGAASLTAYTRDRMTQIREQYALPHWKAKGSNATGGERAPSNSVLGQLFDRWNVWIAQFTLWQRRAQLKECGTKAYAEVRRLLDQAEKDHATAVTRMSSYSHRREEALRKGKGRPVVPPVAGGASLGGARGTAAAVVARGTAAVVAAPISRSKKRRKIVPSADPQAMTIPEDNIGDDEAVPVASASDPDVVREVIRIDDDEAVALGLGLGELDGIQLTERQIRQQAQSLSDAALARAMDAEINAGVNP